MAKTIGESSRAALGVNGPRVNLTVMDDSDHTNDEMMKRRFANYLKR